MDLTIFEVHLDDASFTANAPFAGGDDQEAEAVETAAEMDAETEEEGGFSIAPLVVGLVVVAAVALGVRRMLRSEPDEFEHAISDAEAEAETEVPA